MGDNMKTNMMYLAEYSTDKYGRFWAIDTDRSEAWATLVRGLMQHVQEYDLSDDWIEVYEIVIYEIPQGDVLRDMALMGLKND